MQVQQQLPYQSIVFIKTGVIGGSQQQEDNPVFNYDFFHRHIFQPHYLNNHNCVFYILFHTASIYNWLRNISCRESDLLNSYVSEPNKAKIMNVEVNVDQILSSLQDYVNRWEVVKLSYASPFYVSKVREFGGSVCVHLAKTQQKAIVLSYSRVNSKLFCSKIRCKQCKRQVEVQGQLKEISKYFVSKFSAHKLFTNGKNYESIIVFTKNSIFIKAASRIWYCIDLKSGQTRAVGIGKVDFRQAGLTVYELQSNDVSAAISSFSLEKEIKQENKTKKLIKEQITQSQPVSQEKKEKQMNVQKGQGEKQLKAIKISTDQFAGSHLKIKKLKYQPNQVLLKPDAKGEKYIQEVEKRFLQPKQKDQYELDYDKGKLKKKKEKKHYIQPDYNQIQAQVKQREHQVVDQMSKKIKKRKNKRQPNMGSDSD